ncbi:MAG: lysophospholipid acyltransferase family protein [Candidatus Kapabacteria bacterium]|jgi:1-acyl-sn-glycerol-3-phosphate acyltransferase|nr:lysophospholipid acyltransferase family protein [Candidatus Kapabacteria bacterium]
MIKAKHSKFAELIFKPYIFRMMAKNFHSINLIGDIGYINSDYPLILTPNHSTWWDGFFVYLLNKKILNRKFYIMILEEQLSKFKFFVKLGGFSINKQTPSEIMESLRYTSSIMETNPPPVITIFPQGELLPSFIRPLNFRKGIEIIAGLYAKPVTILPLSIKIEFLSDEKPDLFFRFGNPLVIENRFDVLSDIIRKEVESGLEIISEKILKKEFGIQIHKGKKSVSDK